MQQLRDLVKDNAKLYRDALSSPYLNHKDLNYKCTQIKPLSSDAPPYYEPYYE
jgi:hypothetical protein